MTRLTLAALFAFVLSLSPAAAQTDDGEAWVRAHYIKREARIPMRDGKTLFTSIYSPRDTLLPAGTKVPFLMVRTPYAVGPYGPDAYARKLGPHRGFMEAGYHFVQQDVRGRFMSEGEFTNMTPSGLVRNGRVIDESTDTYDTIEWLLANIPNHNGKVGLYGISYRGFYAAASMIDAHPALKAVTPEAPISDWFFEDFHHCGAFCLSSAFNFLDSFGVARPELTTEWPRGVDVGTEDGYRFFLELGPLRNVNERWFQNRIAFWNDMAAHPNYDEYWQARNILPHLKHVAPAVLTVGGWFDAENLYGALKIYDSVEGKNPDVDNRLIMGPWIHGGWTRTDGSRLGNISFGAKTSAFYQAKIDLPFFEHHLRGGPDPELAEATVFETGTNVWRRFDEWPPPNVQLVHWHFGPNGTLRLDGPASEDGSDAFVSDPAHPVPYSEDITIGITKKYMTDDQRFAATRPDVLTYRSAPLTDDVTIAGPVLASLLVSTSGRDADWIVKLIDEFPADHPADPDQPAGGPPLGGYMMMVRSEAVRGRFRDSYSVPKPFTPLEPTRVDVPLQDTLHTFRAGHRIVVQVQSSWFPFIDRNPQSWVENIWEADAEDYIPAKHRVFRTTRLPSGIVVRVLQGE